MMKRCPVCRKRYLDDEKCGRCGADLLPLAEIEQEADASCAEALFALAANDHKAAKRYAAAALFKRKTEFHQILCGFIESTRN